MLKIPWNEFKNIKLVFKECLLNFNLHELCSKYINNKNKQQRTSGEKIDWRGKIKLGPQRKLF